MTPIWGDVETKLLVVVDNAIIGYLATDCRTIYQPPTKRCRLIAAHNALSSVRPFVCPVGFPAAINAIAHYDPTRCRSATPQYW